MRIRHAALLATIMFAKRPKQEDMPLEGAGVAPIKDKKLEEWAEDFIEKRDAKALMAEEMTALEAKMLDRMSEKQIQVFRFADQELRLKPGKTHVKIKKVKNEGAEGEPVEETAD